MGAHDRHHLRSQPAVYVLPRELPLSGLLPRCGIPVKYLVQSAQVKETPRERLESDSLSSHSEAMAAFPQTMPQSAYNRGIPPPTAMNAPYPMYQPAMGPQGGAMATNMLPAGGSMAPRAGGRPSQGYYSNPAASPVNSPAPMKGTLRPGERIRVGNDTVVIEKYLSEG